MKEPKLNEVFEHEGVKIKCVEDKTGCNGCAFMMSDGDCCEFNCTIKSRIDKTGVTFREVES